MASTTPIPAAGDEPAAKPKRRTFSAEYKLRIVAEYDAAPAGEKGAILGIWTTRREATSMPSRPNRPLVPKTTNPLSPPPSSSVASASGWYS